MDADSGRVLYESNARQRRLIASTTKLMTALVALESGHRLDEVVTIDPKWAGAEGSSIYLKPGEQVRLETLLYGMLLRSGNDAALAVAGFCAGSVEAFVERMNRKAAELGMSDTHFENPNGLDGEAHYSSAYDMALLARACLKNETLANMVSAKSVTMEGRTFTNHNKLLWLEEGCVGLKTGYTEAAGRTLVSAARRDGMTLICVTLCDPDDWRDHQALFDFGFSGYTRVSLAEEGQILRLGLPGSDDRYDGNIRRHGHVRCRLCGAVADIPPVAVGEPEDTAGYVLEACAVAYCGLCPDCQRRQRESV